MCCMFIFPITCSLLVPGVVNIIIFIYNCNIAIPFIVLFLLFHLKVIKPLTEILSSKSSNLWECPQMECFSFLSLSKHLNLVLPVYLCSIKKIIKSYCSSLHSSFKPSGLWSGLSWKIFFKKPTKYDCSVNNLSFFIYIFIILVAEVWLFCT